MMEPLKLGFKIPLWWYIPVLVLRKWTQRVSGQLELQSISPTGPHAEILPQQNKSKTKNYVQLSVS